MPAPQHKLDFGAHTYIAVTLDRAAGAQLEPRDLAAAHGRAAYVGPVGELADVQLVSVPRDAGPDAEADVLGWLKARSGVVHVEVQAPPRTRAKRGGAEL
jgi:hypothetical protein